MPEVRLIDANTAVDNADKCYNDWVLAMAAAEGTRQINMVYKKQELFKAVRKVINHCPTINPETLRPVAHWENNPKSVQWNVLLAQIAEDYITLRKDCLRKKLITNSARTAGQEWRMWNEQSCFVKHPA